MLAKIGKTSWQALENMEFLCLKNEQRQVLGCDICHKPGCQDGTPQEEVEFLRASMRAIGGASMRAC